MFRFILTVLSVTVLLAGSVVLFVPERPSLLFPTSFFLLFTTVSTYRYLQRATQPEDFVRLYLAMIVLKLFMGLGYAVLMVVMDRPAVPANVVYFLIAYFVFTAVEVGFLYNKRNR